MTYLVTGASGVVGRPLLDKVAELGESVLAVSRNPEHSAQPKIRWLKTDLCDSISNVLTPTIQVVIHTAPLWLLPEHIAAFRKCGVQRIVAFSSTSVLAKAHSHSDYERNLVQRLTAAESECLQRSQSQDIPITIFRPTMIYGYGRDHNVSAISHFIRKYGFFPVSNKALGLRQPVHADDLVNATLAVIDNTKTFSKCYQMSGGEVLTYRDMIRRIFDGLGKTVRLLVVPKQLYRGVIWVYAGLSRNTGLTPDMVSRMSQNLNFSHMPATRDFHYRPGAFLTNPDRDLV